MRRALLRRSSLAAAGIAMAAFIALGWSSLQNTESTLAIRATSQGMSVPDGFSVLHHLDANGIAFKSITPQNNQLVIKFDSGAQRDAAQRVLYRSLPRGFIIAREDEGSPATQWLQRLRGDGHRLG